MIKKLTNSIFKILLLAVSLSFHLQAGYAQTSTAGILPNAKTTFLDANGNPLSSGKVYFYSPGTTTAKTTWQDINKTVPNTNPVNLDAAGRALIWGDGSYRQQVYDRNNNLQWDQTTAISGTGSGGTTLGDGLPVGTILPWSGIVAPNNYQFAYGQALSRTTYAELYQAIVISSSGTCTGGSPTISNISDTTYISVGATVESICVTGSPTVASKTSNSITLSSNATINTSASLLIYPYGNGDGLTTFNAPDLRGYVIAGRCNMGGVDCLNLTSSYFSSNSSNTPSGINAKGGGQSNTLLAANLPPHTHTSPTLTDPGHFHTYTSTNNASVLSGGGSFSTGTASAANTGTSTTGITLSANTGTNASGTSTPFSNVQPTLTLNYVIKTKPDVNLTSTYGVAAIGGMTGIIACGTNITCAGNTISASFSLSLGLGLNYNGSGVLQTEPATAKLWPSATQVASATVPWNAVDPWGNSINCTGTTTQCFQEFVNAAYTNNWSWKVLGKATLISNSAISIPPCFLRHQYVDSGVSITFAALGAATLFTIDSNENCDTELLGAFNQNAADTGTVVSFNGTTNTASGNKGFYASKLEVGSVAPSSGGTGVKLDLTTGGIIGNHFTIHDVNGGTTGIQVTNPGTGFIAFEQNKIFLIYNHNQTGRVVQIGTSTTNQTNMRNNVWYPGRIDPGTGATVAWDSWASYDTYVGLSIVNETASAATGLKFESGANFNTLIGGKVQATTALSDGGVCNSYISISGVGNNISYFGGISGCTGVGSAGAATGNLNLPATNDTIVARDTTDTLTNKTLASSTDVIGGVTMALGSDAQGDVYYRSSTGVLTRLAPGTAGQALNTGGSGANPSWGSHRQMIGLTSGGATLAQNSTAFQTTSQSSGEGFVQMLCPKAGTFKNLYISSTAPAAGQTLTATLRVNGSNTALTCVVTGTGSTCNDTTHTATCTAGQSWSLGLVTSATTGSLLFVSGGVEFDNP